jgi:NADPH:quinone reductase-like Zn-dependent oxidoreductase
MSKAVRFNEYGDIDVLTVVEVDRPAPGEGEVLVEVKAAAINPGEAHIRTGALHALWPATFPSGQGSDLAGVVVEVGPGVTQWAVGDEVAGFTDLRASHAELVRVYAKDLVAKPANVPWEVAGSLYIAGTTAYAEVRAVGLSEGDTVVVTGAAGGVGALAVQLARKTGATVIGLASAGNHEWLRGLGVIPVEYGDGVEDRIRKAAGGQVDAFLDNIGGGYVDLAVELGVRPSRINTVADREAAARVGVGTEGNMSAATAEVVGELIGLVAAGELEVPIARVYPLAEVRDAYRELERRHTRGKIVLRP